MLASNISTWVWSDLKRNSERPVFCRMDPGSIFPTDFQKERDFRKFLKVQTEFSRRLTTSQHLFCKTVCEMTKGLFLCKNLLLQELKSYHHNELQTIESVQLVVNTTTVFHAPMQFPILTNIK